MQVKPYEQELDIGTKPWEESMWSAVRVASMQSRFDLVNLYVKLEEKSKSYLKNGEMNEGDKFRVPLESGAIFEITFYNNYSTVIAERANGKREVAISKEDSYKKEYRYLIATSSTLEEANLGIGPKAPEEFHKVLANARVGDVFVFDNGQSYVCSVKFDNYKEFKKTCGLTNAPKFSDIEYSEGFSVRMDRPADVQEAYRLLKDPYTWDIKTRTTTIDDARLVLNKLFANPNETKEVALGPNKLIAQKSKTDKGLVYFNEKGEQISEQKVLLMLAWLEANPNQIEIKRLKPTFPNEEMNDIVFKRGLDELMASRQFANAAELVEGYCQACGKVLEISMSSYVKDEEDYEAVSYLFKVDDNGNPQMFKVLYEDNDLSKNILKIEPTTVDEFQGYCNQKYDDRFLYIKSKVLEECHEKFPNWQGAMFDKIVDVVVAKQIANSPPPLNFEVKYAPKDEEFLVALAGFEEDKGYV